MGPEEKKRKRASGDNKDHYDQGEDATEAQLKDLHEDAVIDATSDGIADKREKETPSSIQQLPEATDETDAAGASDACAIPEQGEKTTTPTTKEY